MSMSICQLKTIWPWKLWTLKMLYSYKYKGHTPYRPFDRSHSNFNLSVFLFLGLNMLEARLGSSDLAVTCSVVVDTTGAAACDPDDISAIATGPDNPLSVSPASPGKRELNKSSASFPESDISGIGLVWIGFGFTRASLGWGTILTGATLFETNGTGLGIGNGFSVEVTVVPGFKKAAGWRFSELPPGRTRGINREENFLLSGTAKRLFPEAGAGLVVVCSATSCLVLIGGARASFFRSSSR